MSNQAGALLWNRKTVAFGPSQASVDVDTGLTQVNRGFGEDPPLGGSGLIASRVQVIPLAPTAGWADVAHGEPFLDPATNTIHVVFVHGGVLPEPPLPFQFPSFNVLFWDPHTSIGPGKADTYNAPIS